MTKQQQVLTELCRWVDGRFNGSEPMRAVTNEFAAQINAAHAADEFETYDSMLGYFMEYLYRATPPAE